MANLILLNGTSSSGKTSIGLQLREMLEEPYLLTGIDQFITMLSPRYFNPDLRQPEPAIPGAGGEPPSEERRFLPDEGFRWFPPSEGSAAGVQIKTGAVGHQVITAMHHAIAAMARRGHYLIIDHVLLEPRWLDEAVGLLRECDVLFVGVRCPLEVVEQRERDRADRTVGQARGHFEIVHAHGIYDLEVDTSELTPGECAARIVQRLQAGRPSEAFERLRRRHLLDPNENCGVR